MDKGKTPTHPRKKLFSYGRCSLIASFVKEKQMNFGVFANGF